MRPPSSIRLTAPLFPLVAFAGIYLPCTVSAFVVAADPPDPVTTWTPIADTGSAAPLKHNGSGSVTAFASFLPPIVKRAGTGTGIPQIAFKGKMVVGGPVTLAKDEGIWSNADPINWAAAGYPGPTAWMVAQESDTVGSRTIGNGGGMVVQALQATVFGGTLFTTNSDLNPLLNFSVYEGSGLNGLAGTTVGIFTDGSRAVTEGTYRIAAWTKPFPTTRYWDAAVVSGFAHGITVGPSYGTTDPKVPCSPAISEYGAVAHRARSGPLPPMPWFRKDFIQVDPNIAGGFLPSPVQAARRNDLTPTGERLGIFHPNLMALTGGPNVYPTVAWQMSNMYTSVPPVTTGVNVLGAPIPNSNSLWCWRGDAAPGPNSYAQIARVGMAATDIGGGVTFTSFYALHVVDDLPNYPDSNVFYGVNLSSGKRAIYMQVVNIVATATSVLTPPQLIATDDPGGSPMLWVPAIYAGTYPITGLFPWFSVDLRGNVLIKATLAGAPAGQRQCLIVAKSSTNHALQMRAQSDSASFILPTLTHGPQRIANFAITNPEQGPLGRGQAIDGQSFGALVLFPGGNGVYVGQ